jgi:hypothetical protein
VSFIFADPLYYISFLCKLGTLFPYWLPLWLLLSHVLSLKASAFLWKKGCLLCRASCFRPFHILPSCFQGLGSSPSVLLISCSNEWLLHIGCIIIPHIALACLDFYLACNLRFLSCLSLEGRKLRHLNKHVGRAFTGHLCHIL